MACRISRSFHNTLCLVTLLVLTSSLVAGCTASAGLPPSRTPVSVDGGQPDESAGSLPGIEDDVTVGSVGIETPEVEPPVSPREPRVCPSGSGVGTALPTNRLSRMSADGDVQNGFLPATLEGDGPDGDTPDRGDPASHDGEAAGNAAPDAPHTGGDPTDPVPPSPSDAEPASLEQALRGYLSNLSGTYGVHVIDLTTGETTSVNADQAFAAASTFKVPMAMYVLDLVNQGQTSLDEPLTYRPEDWEEGTGLIQLDLVEGDCYTVSELLDLMLIESDNIATNMLLRRFGESNAFSYMVQLGGTVTHLDSGRRATTPREMAQYLAQAFRTAEAGDSLYRTLIDRLMHTAFPDRIAAGVPEGVPVAHKIGTVPGMVHDVGVVLLPDRPFVLAIFSVDVDEAEAAVRLAEITRLVCGFQLNGADLSPTASIGS